jgi:hypothetical protein
MSRDGNNGKQRFYCAVVKIKQGNNETQHLMFDKHEQPLALTNAKQ